MTTKLEGPLRREVDVDGAAYTLTITPQGLALVPKGRRKGHELSWTALVSGDAALATALNASLRLRPRRAARREVQTRPAARKALTPSDSGLTATPVLRRKCRQAAVREREDATKRAYSRERGVPEPSVTAAHSPC